MLDKTTNAYLYDLLVKDFEALEFNINNLDPKYDLLEDVETYLMDMESCVTVMRDVCGYPEPYIREYNKIHNRVYSEFKN